MKGLTAVGSSCRPWTLNRAGSGCYTITKCWVAKYKFWDHALNVLAAIDVDLRAVHIRSGVRAQHIDDLRHFVGRAEPVQRDLLLDDLVRPR